MFDEDGGKDKLLKTLRQQVADRGELPFMRH